MPWRSRSNSASARGSGSPAKIGALLAQRPCVAVIASERRREKRRGRRSGRGAWKRRAARSGCHASFVTSPDQTSSQRAGAPSRRRARSRAAGRTRRARCHRARHGCGRRPPLPVEEASRGGPGRAHPRGNRRATRSRPGTDPHDLAGGGELVELRRLEPGHAAREGCRSPRARREATLLAAGRAPPSALPADRSRATRAGTGRGPPRRPARPPCAARRGSRGGGGGERPARTIPAPTPPGRSSPRTRRPSRSRRPSSASARSDARPKRAAASAVVNGPRPRA